MAENELPSMDEYSPPWLMSTDESNYEEQTFFTLSKNSTHIKKITELQGKSIDASIMGWLILRDRENPTMYTLWNPITRNSIPLPELELPEGIDEPDSFILTSPPETGSECVLLLFCKGSVFLCKPTIDGCCWVKQSIEYDGKIVRIVRGCSVNGVIYGYADLFYDNGEDVSLRTIFARLTVDIGLNSVVFEALSVPCPMSLIVYRMIGRFVNYLVEVGGELYAVSMIPRQLDLESLDGYDLFKVFVWKLELLEMKWILVESLGGDRALLLGRNCCSWCWAGGRVEGDCIYIGAGIIHQYRLRDSSYSFLASHDSINNSSDFAMWFMPRCPTRLMSLVKEVENITGKMEVTTVGNTKEIEELEGMNRDIQTSLLFRLPSEVMISAVADRLHWFDFMNLRATCKNMRSELPKTPWKANSPYPLFMFVKNNEGICELWDPCYQNNGFITKKLPFSPSIVSTIEFSKEDWLMLRSHEGRYLQYINLFTGESVEYPTESLIPGLANFVLSTSPNSPDCLTIGIGGMASVEISLLRAGNVGWEMFQIDMQGGIDFQSNYNSSQLYHNGAFHFLDENGKLGVLKILDNGLSWHVYKGPFQDEDSTHLGECYIAELDRQIVYVFIQDLGSKVQVYTFDVNQEIWTEIKCLGNYTLFVSSASSFSVPAYDSCMRNRIYVPKRIVSHQVVSTNSYESRIFPEGISYKADLFTAVKTIESSLLNGLDTKSVETLDVSTIGQPAFSLGFDFVFSFTELESNGQPCYWAHNQDDLLVELVLQILSGADTQSPP
ncbi:hypothetical protein KSS87_015765 [Heliosperma pusillum]|nr:hypothetical protein KSS87_015765 [Heliosperma pusillum]